MCPLRLMKHTMLWRISDFCGAEGFGEKGCGERRTEEKSDRNGFQGIAWRLEIAPEVLGDFGTAGEGCSGAVLESKQGLHDASRGSVHDLQE